jgi:hypothetical protein
MAFFMERMMIGLLIIDSERIDRSEIRVITLIIIKTKLKDLTKTIRFLKLTICNKTQSSPHK